MKVHIEADIPRELVTTWLQYVRDFDVQHAPNVHFVIMGLDEPGLTAAEASNILAAVRPPFTHLMRFKTKD